jgi:hypothetical protein
MRTRNMQWAKQCYELQIRHKFEEYLPMGCYAVGYCKNQRFEGT